jgi:diaminohydroxyphosphoribosylaminopyrimidine deaminase/5-amino-6-(5-phosphoribosylamino)uracil reductase
MEIATAALHSAWVSSAVSRQQVYRERALSDAVVVGGNTVRLDNPRLTTRVEGFPNQPTRVVLSRSLDMPLDAHIWDIEAAPTLVFTEEASCDKHVLAQLARRGVQVMALPELTPQAVVRECHLRGMVRLFWECGGTLAAPAISDGAVGKVLAFVAPKIIGGGRKAPGPVGDLGFEKMTQAIDLVDPHFETVGPDLLVSGHLPSSGGLCKLVRDCALPKPNEHGLSLSEILRSRRDDSVAAQPGKETRVKFYKAWDAFGALSNFYPSEVRLSMDCSGKPRSWRTVEHFYQAHKFCPGSGACNPWVEPPGGAAAEDADVNARRRELIERIWRAETPENAARVGRWAENTQPELMRPDWVEAKLEVMETALRAKFRDDAAARAVLLSTGAATLAEYSPRDAFWGSGADGRGQNHLGRLLMLVRASLRAGGERDDSGF